jgi:hypothetical protein
MILPTTTVEPFFRTTARGSGFQLNETKVHCQAYRNGPFTIVGNDLEW